MMIPANYADLLQTKAMADVATLGENGEPQVNPVWFEWDGETLHFSLTKARQKYRNLMRDPRIAISIIDPTNPYRRLELRGKVVRVDEDPNSDFINKMAKKYLNEDVNPYSKPGDQRVVMIVKPEHVTVMG